MENAILVVCTANVCRSPMAEALLARSLGEVGSTIMVRSAGVRAVAGVAAPPDARKMMAERGLDISAHRSRPIGPDDLADHDLVITMTREHIRDLAVRSRDDFPRIFTLKELARRCQADAPRGPDENLRTWAVRMSAGRAVGDLVGGNPHDDIDDPMGRSLRTYRRIVAEIEGAIQATVHHLASAPPGAQ